MLASFAMHHNEHSFDRIENTAKSPLSSIVTKTSEMSLRYQSQSRVEVEVIQARR